MQKNDLKKYLDKKNCFKLILGANNENYEEITKLVALYSAAGCRFFDLNASAEALLAAKKGLEYAEKKDCFLCISVCTKDDPHGTKCKIIPDLCANCKQCAEICIQNAISFKESKKAQIDEKKCIGCANCLQICPKRAIERIQKTTDWEKSFFELKDSCDCIEFHVATDDIEEIDKKWDFLCKNFEGFLSICINRSIFSSREMILQLKKMISKRNSKNVMIQADGTPMSGGCDDFRTTLQAIAAADIIEKENFNVPVIMSGGTNSKTPELAKLCKINVSGIAMGSYARKIVKEYVESEDFLKNNKKFNQALKIAKKLVKICENQNNEK